VLDFVQFNRRAALNSSLKHSSCSYLPPQDAVPGDEAIHMYPFDFAPQCEVSSSGTVWFSGSRPTAATASCILERRGSSVCTLAGQQ
jgi:hypothetical protein